MITRHICTSTHCSLVLESHGVNRFRPSTPKYDLVRVVDGARARGAVPSKHGLITLVESKMVAVVHINSVASSSSSSSDWFVLFWGCVAPGGGVLCAGIFTVCSRLSWSVDNEWRNWRNSIILSFTLDHHHHHQHLHHHHHQMGLKEDDCPKWFYDLDWGLLTVICIVVSVIIIV